MKKFYNKKEVSVEKTPILLRLERRHTLMEGGQDPNKERQASRANSVGSTGDTTSSVSTPGNQSRTSSVEKCMSDGKQSIFSQASTVVITESELSSSWLYNNQKAQIDSTNETNLDFKSGMPSNNFDSMEQETRREPRPKPSEPTRPVRRNSCCCYLTIAFFICIASLGILATIGGIIYMELFSAYGQKNKLSVDPAFSHKRNKVNYSTGNGRNEVERILEETIQKGITVPFSVTGGGGGLPGWIESNTSLTSETEHYMDNESNSMVSIRNKNEFSQVSDEKDSLALHHGKDPAKIVDRDHKSPQVLPDGLRNDESLKEVTRELSDQEKLDLFMKFNEEMKKIFNNEGQIPRELTVDTTSASKTEIEQEDDLGNQELESSLENSSYSETDMINNWWDLVTNHPLDLNSDHSSAVIRSPLAYLPSDITMDISSNKENISVAEFNPQNENFHPSMDSKTDSFPPSNIPNNIKEASNDTAKKVSNILNLNHTDGSPNDSTSEQATENFPTERKGVPFEFFRRLGFDEASLAAHPALTVEDMNVKFSLAEALKYLRSLDTSSKLPTSRQKSEIPLNRSPKKLADAGTEREEYLTKLRENLYS